MGGVFTQHDGMNHTDRVSETSLFAPLMAPSPGIQVFLWYYRGSMALTRIVQDFRGLFYGWRKYAVVPHHKCGAHTLWVKAGYGFIELGLYAV